MLLLHIHISPSLYRYHQTILLDVEHLLQEVNIADLRYINCTNLSSGKVIFAFCIIFIQIKNLICSSLASSIVLIIVYQNSVNK